MGWDVGVCSRLMQRSCGALLAMAVLQDVLLAHCSSGVPWAMAGHAVLAWPCASCKACVRTAVKRRIGT